MRFNQIPSNAGLGLELKVIAAVVVGGTSINGGRGSIAGTLLGVALLGMIGPALTFLGVDNIAQNPKLYREAIERGRFAIARGFALSDDDRIRRSIIERLMCDLAVNLANHATDARTDFAHELAQLTDLAADGLVTVQGTQITVPETMRPFVRKVASVFDTHLQGAEKRHSRAV